MTKEQRGALKNALQPRRWPTALEPLWLALCADVAAESARIWRQVMPSRKQQLRLLWRLLRIATATYFVLGAARSGAVRLRVDSAWDWQQAYVLQRFDVCPRPSGQPEVGWQALVRRRSDGIVVQVDGHIEVRWSHGRFNDVPEAKVYLDTAHKDVPGYNVLT